MASPTDQRIAFLGVGAIAESMVSGFNHGRSPWQIVLSPRNKERAARLSVEYSNVEVAPTNQAAVDAADTVIVCLRPDDVNAELEQLRFAASQTVISVVAGLPVSALDTLVSPAQVTARAIPLPAVAQRQGVVALYSPLAVAPNIFHGLGETMVVPSEEALDLLSAATSTVAAHFKYLTTIVGWLVARGVDSDVADTYVRKTFDALSDLSHPLPLSQDSDTPTSGHATRGGVNQQFLEALTDASVYQTMQSALDAVFERLRAR